MKTRRDSGRKGGLVTLERYGPDQLREWGKRGGRPRSRTYDQIRQRQRLERNNNKGGNGSPGSNLRELKALLKQRQRSNGEEITQAGTVADTPREQVPARKEAV